MKELILIFCAFFIVTTPVFALDQPLPEISSDSLQQEDLPTIEGLATSDHYPSCHRMKHWAAKQPLKTVSAE